MIKYGHDSLHKQVLTLSTVILIMILTFGLLSMGGCANSDTSSWLTIHLIDVGQGDSQLIITPQGSSVLIDAGDLLQGDVVTAYLTRQGIRRIDYLILTHPHSDHIGGVPTILEQFQVSQVYLPPVVHTSQLYERILTHLTTHQIPTSIVRKTSSILVEDGLEVKILSSGQDFQEHLNNWSLVTHIAHQSQVFLFMGDAEAESEKALMSSLHPSALRANVLKAGHHGSNTSSSDLFLDMVLPDIVLISCGENNPYSHPHPTLLQRLEKRNTWIYRTDLQGSIILQSDGRKVISHQQPINH